MARLHQDQSGLPVLLCLSPGRDVRERDRQQPRPQDVGFQSAAQAGAGQELQDSVRETGADVLHFGFSAEGRRSVAAGMLGDDEAAERLPFLLLHEEDRPARRVSAARLG